MTGSRIDAGKKQQGPPDGKIEKRVWIKASAAVIYKALTDSKELARWFCDRASCDPREGGELVAHWKTGKSGQKGRALFTRIVPNTIVELVWIDDDCGTPADGPSHTLGYTIRPKAAMTEVVMVDKGAAPSDQEAFSVLNQGWNSVLLELKDYCERRERSVNRRTLRIPPVPQQ